MTRHSRLSRSVIVLAVLAISIVDSASTSREKYDSELRVTITPSELVLAAGEATTVDIDVELILIEVSPGGQRSRVTLGTVWGDVDVSATPDTGTEAGDMVCGSRVAATELSCSLEVTARDRPGQFAIAITVSTDSVLAEIEDDPPNPHSLADTSSAHTLAVAVGTERTPDPPSSTTTTVAAAPPATMGCPQFPPAATESATAGAATGSALGAEVIVATAPGAAGTFADGVSTVRIEGAGAVILAHRHPDAAWTPCVDGPIGSIRFEMTGSAASAGDTGQVGIRPILTQNDSVFTAGPWFLGPADGTAAFTWDLTAADFSRLTGTANLDLVDGPPVGFGYTVAISCPETSDCTATQRTFTLQRWAMQITPGG